MEDRLGSGVLRGNEAGLRKTGKISYVEVVWVFREVTGYVDMHWASELSS